MQKINLNRFSIAIVLFATALFGCNGSGGDKAPVPNADSAYKSLLKAHDESMVGYMRVEDIQKKIKMRTDSLRSLPEELRSVNQNLEQQLSNTSIVLKSAYDKMDAWMAATSFDTLKNDPPARTKYFTDKQMQLDSVNTQLNRALHLADSLLMKK